jgi:hypothetical protein
MPGHYPQVQNAVALLGDTEAEGGENQKDFIAKAAKEARRKRICSTRRSALKIFCSLASPG